MEFQVFEAPLIEKSHQCISQKSECLVRCCVCHRSQMSLRKLPNVPFHRQFLLTFCLGPFEVNLSPIVKWDIPISLTRAGSSGICLSQGGLRKWAHSLISATFLQGARPLLVDPALESLVGHNLRWGLALVWWPLAAKLWAACCLLFSLSLCVLRSKLLWSLCLALWGTRKCCGISHWAQKHPPHTDFGVVPFQLICRVADLPWGNSCKCLSAGFVSHLCLSEPKGFYLSHGGIALSWDTAHFSGE